MPESNAKPFSGIFVSYRRDDSSGHAGRLFDRLVTHFGKDRIFMDIDTIEPGEDFITVIENAVGSCDILIAIIGRSWLASGSGQTGRLDNPHDFVRLEIGTALRRDIRVIPVLVQRASMPKPQDLPEELVNFSRRNAVELTDLRWQSDVDQLIIVMERVLAKRAAEAQAAEARQVEAERRRREQEEAKLAEARQVKLAAEAKQRAEQEAEQRAKQEAEDRAENARRRAEEERLAKEAEEQRRLEQLAEAAAASRALEQKRQDEERHALEAKARVEAEEGAAEARRLAKQKFDGEERERQQMEAARVAAVEKKRRELVEVERLRAAAENAQAKQTQNAPTVVPSPSTGQVQAASSLFGSISSAPERKTHTRRNTILLAITGVAVVTIIVLLMWLRSLPHGQTQTTAGLPKIVATVPKPTAAQPPPGMVYVPAGEFSMGRDKSAGGDEFAHPAHPMAVKAFFIDTHEVTCEQFAEYLQNHSVTGDEVNQCAARDGQTPVTGVTWDDANLYAKWAGKRLPTEAEWEYAARGQDGRLYPWGPDWVANRANADGADTKLAKVGAFTGQSPFGLFDMVGNAWEWTSSTLSVYPGGRPQATVAGVMVIRGGSYLENQKQATTTYRGNARARGGNYDKTGFRCVQDVDAPAKTQ